jgi:hypothetical protein
MKVLNLRCAQGHGFEGWFGSEEDFSRQSSQGLLDCPLCGDARIERLPSAPRLSLSQARAPQETAPGVGADKAPVAGAPQALQALQALQTAWLRAVDHLVANTEDVGERFSDEARRIHYGEIQARGIRGQATPEQRQALSEEGIEVFSMPLPDGLKGPKH